MREHTERAWWTDKYNWRTIGTATPDSSAEHHPLCPRAGAGDCGCHGDLAIPQTLAGRGHIRLSSLPDNLRSNITLPVYSTHTFRTTVLEFIHSLLIYPLTSQWPELSVPSVESYWSPLSQFHVRCPSLFLFCIRGGRPVSQIKDTAVQNRYDMQKHFNLHQTKQFR